MVKRARTHGAPSSTKSAAVSGRRRVLVLGGGPAGLAAAWALSSSEALRERVHVTVVEARDRLGGKCATGRGESGRVEEHGVHLLQGWYHNAFRILRAAYEERASAGLEPDPERRSLEAWFSPQSSMLLSGTGADADLAASAFVFPRTAGLPGDGAPKDDLACLVRLASLGASALARHAGAAALGDALPALATALEPLARGALGTRPTLLALRAAALATSSALAVAARAAPHGSEAAHALGFARLATAILRGLLDDAWDPARGRLALDRLDDVDLATWLAARGGGDVVDEPVLRFFYNVLLTTRAAASTTGGLAASVAVRLLVRSADYRGAFYWRPREGTGDGIVLPIAEALAARGVAFVYGHRLAGVELEDAGLVSALRFDVSDDTTPNLGEANGRPAWVGPRRTELRFTESARFRRGADFDDVVLAIPPAALRGKVDALEARDPRWAAMMHGLESVPTAHAQLWVARALGELGWDATAAGAAAPDEGLVTTLPRPFQSWADMSHVIASEGWAPGDRPGGVLYLTCACEPAWGDEPRAAESAFRDALAHHLARAPSSLWVGRGSAPAGWPFDALHHGWSAQYFAANVAAEERYVVARPGRARVRLAPWGSGIPNLALAGDWTAGGLRAGCVEGAMTSGLEAADALLARAGLTPSWGFHRYVEGPGDA